jgi:hypothetical protein
MLANRNQPIVAGLLVLGIAGFAVATALPFNDRIEYRIGNRIESQPIWLVPPKVEFRSIERGFGGIKITLALLATGASGLMMLIARKEGALEPMRQRVKKYQEKAQEFDYAAESAYQMAQTQQRYKTLLEADEVAFQDEIEAAYCESLGIDPRQQQPQLTGTATLESISNPGDKVEASAAPAIEQATGPKMPNLSKYPSILIYGVPGAGKSTFTEEEVTKRLKEGHRVIVLDPHAACGQWEGCEVVGAGMDYEAIDTKLLWFQKQVKDRYKTISSQLNPKFQPLTIVGEEFTNWSKRCSNSGEHFQTVNSDIRKAECYSIIVSHTRNLAGLGDAKGMGALRDESMLEVEILGEYNAKTERATPRFEALVKMPGEALTERTLVKLAKHQTMPKDVTTNIRQTATETDSDYLERTYKLEFDLSKPELSEPGAEPLNRRHDGNDSDSKPRFTPMDLTREQALKLIQRLRTELNQTQIIERLWECKKGGSEAWKKAYAEFKELTKEEGNGNNDS